ncbi:beta-lactamase family protein [Natronosporangium hydrolyticum]|uniref:Beta-lactamase family protein n=1 Tax=Natronosporangium hydrolyticum TaxID=2811111 RepID=A0A895YEH3_9ACTN|nr:serine hydrolase domain-containing protein [Natronosporangium hydrolyticum]QSB13809.1 beta-lactamase family protein [Natronosporangium hydrolyticum]
MEDLSELVAQWPVEQVAAGVTDPAETVAATGDLDWRVRTASVSKLLVGLAALVAIEEEALTLAEPAGPPGATVQHLLAHAAGFAFDDDKVLAPPEQRRIYSNVGIETFARHLAERTGIPFGDYLTEAVLQPLGMADTELVGSPAHGIESTVADLLRFARELLAPTLVSAETLATATSVHYPALAGVVPGFGKFTPNPWGLAFEIRGEKQPHWTGQRHSPQTFGHFGATGTFLWVDPAAQLGCAVLTGRDFGQWAGAAWPPFNDAVLERFAR